MSYKALIPFSYYGTRIEKGQEIELSKADLESFGDLVEALGDAPVEAAPEAEKPVSEMSKDELKAKAAALGLSDEGNKADLVERITLHLEAAPEAAN